MICFTLLPEKAGELSPLLRCLFRLPGLKTKAARMGKVVRVTGEQVTYYQAHDSRTYMVPLP